MKYQTQKYSLANLGRLRAGYSYRTAGIYNPNGKYLGIGSGAITDGRIDAHRLSPVDLPVKDPAKYLIQDGDILFRIKGGDLEAIEVRHLPPNTVVLDPYAVLTPDLDRVNAKYLIWYYNHPTTGTRKERELVTYCKMPYITYGKLPGFEIELPAIEIQQQLSRMLTLRERERQLVTQVEKLRDVIIDRTLGKLVFNEK